MRNGSLIVFVLLLVFGFLLIVSGILIFNCQIESESSVDWFGENVSFVIPAGEYILKEKEIQNGVLEVLFTVIKGDFVKFFVLDESNYLKWRNRQSYQTPAFIQEGGTPLTGSGELYIFIKNGKWFFIWDNSYDLTADKEITTLVRYQQHHILEK